MSEVLEVAFTQLGTLEQGKNKTLFGAWYGEHAGQNWNGQPWCAMFVSWCYWKSGFALPEMQAPGFSGFASVAIGLEACYQRGWWVDAPEPGDLVFLALGTQGKPSHVGLVVLASEEQDIIVTIEGNTSPADLPDGVYLMVRGFADVAAFARPIFDPNKTCHGPCWVCGVCPV